MSLWFTRFLVLDEQIQYENDVRRPRASKRQDRLTTTSSFSSLGSCQRSLFLFYERLKARDPGYVHFFVFLDLNRFLSLFFSFFISFIHSTAIFFHNVINFHLSSCGNWNIYIMNQRSMKDMRWTGEPHVRDASGTGSPGRAQGLFLSFYFSRDVWRIDSWGLTSKK